MRPASARMALCVMLALAAGGCERASLFASFFGRNFASLGRSTRPPRYKNEAPVRPEARLAALWVGHATVLVQIEDRFILTDPVFTSTVGQVSKRMVAPGIEIEHLPRIDAAIISHMHFDHLSLGSLDLLEHRIDRVYLPEGGAVYVPSSAVPLVELPSWRSHEVAGLRVTAVPVKHNGWRYTADRDWMTRSYTGYVIEYRGVSVYFGGDTAYTPAFRETRERFTRLDLAILPIAPIHPRWFMCKSHIDPREALRAFGDLGARYMLPMHYDTFVNSLDEYGEAPRMLRELLPQFDLDEQRVAVLQHGEQRVFLRR